MKRSSLVIPFLVSTLLACQATSPSEPATASLPTGTPASPSPTPLAYTPTPTFVPTFEPSPTVVPETNISEVLSVNAQYVSIPSLGIYSMYVNGYSSDVTLTPNLFTQFSLACRDFFLDKKQNNWVPYDVDPSCIALLAHNYLHPGMAIEEGMRKGEEIFIQNDAGQVLKYEVSEILNYQAVPPTGKGQVLINIENGEVLTVDQVMQYIYNRDGDTTLGAGDNYLVIQTCIWEDTNGNGVKDPGVDGGDNWLWGRKFVIGRLVDVYDLNSNTNSLVGDYELEGIE